MQTCDILGAVAPYAARIITHLFVVSSRQRSYDRLRCEKIIRLGDNKMFRINHNDAIELEHQVRRLYSCDRGGVSGMADADYFEGHPIQAAVLVVSYIHANHRESGPYQFDEFLNKYETIFEYPDENNAADEVRNYIDELSAIVEQYI